MILFGFRIVKFIELVDCVLSGEIEVRSVVLFLFDFNILFHTIAGLFFGGIVSHSITEMTKISYKIA